MKKRLASFLLLTVAFAACRKTSVQTDPVDPGLATDAQLEIALNDTYLPASKLDSAVVVWQSTGIAGTTQTVALQRSGNKLFTPLSNFRKTGNGTLTVQLFTQTKTADHPLQREKRFAYTLSHSTPLLLTAPAGFTDAAWNPRMMCRNRIGDAGAAVVIGLRPDDACFELKGVDTSLSKRIVVERSFYRDNLINPVATKTWTGNASNLDRYGNLTDRAYFETLPVQLAGNPWNKSLIKVQFYKQLNPHYIYESEFVLDRP